jgi:hypothetical protein
MPFLHFTHFWWQKSTLCLQRKIDMLEGMKSDIFSCERRKGEVYMIFNSIVCRKLYLLTFYCSSPAGQYPKNHRPAQP